MRNHYTIDGDTTTIYCKSKGDIIEVLIDTEDLPRLQEYRTWCINLPYGKQVKPYVIAGVKGSTKRATLHRMLMGFPEGMVVDHKDGNTFNNKKENLRVVTQGENIEHCWKDNLSKGSKRIKCTEDNPVGVVWHKRDKRWIARIKVDGKRIDIGRFKEKADAIHARQEAEKQYWSED